MSSFTMEINFQHPCYECDTFEEVERELCSGDLIDLFENKQIDISLKYDCGECGAWIGSSVIMIDDLTKDQSKELGEFYKEWDNA